MSCPLFSSPLAPSPLPATPDSLRALADAVLAWGKTYGGEGSTRGGGLSQTETSVLRAMSAVKTAIDDHGGDGGGGGGSNSCRGNDGDGDRTENGQDDSLFNGARNTQNDATASSAFIPTAAAANSSGNSSRSCANTSDDDIQNPGITPEDDDGDDEATDTSLTCAAGIAVIPERKATSASCTALTLQSSSTAITTTTTVTPTRDVACWKTGRIALEMQAPWAKRLLDGRKTVETRGYPLPAGLVGRWIELIESQPGRDGVSALGDGVRAGASGLTAVGKAGDFLPHVFSFFFLGGSDV